jgi:biopolymer transport protein TolR
MISLFQGSTAAIATVPGDHGLDVWSPSARHNERVRKRRSQYLCRIDVSGHASIFFVLAFIFMAYFLLPSHSTVSVDLPQTKHFSWLPGAIREDAILVAVTRNGMVFFGTHRIAPDELPDQIRISLRAGAENRIYISADARAKYLDVKTVLDSIRQSGVRRVSFITESRPH